MTNPNGPPAPEGQFGRLAAEDYPIGELAEDDRSQEYMNVMQFGNRLTANTVFQTLGLTRFGELAAFTEAGLREAGLDDEGLKDVKRLLMERELALAEPEDDPTYDIQRA